jgi:hypothetical protein
MAANADPIYIRRGNNTTNGTTGMSQGITSAAADYAGDGANNVLVFTADATNGSYVERIRFKAKGTNTASVARIFINNGSTNGTATNNTFYGEQTLPATSATAVAATPEIDYAMNVALLAGHRIYVGLGTAVAAGWVATAVAGDY